MDIIKIEDVVNKYNNTDDILKDTSLIIDTTRKYAYQTVNTSLVLRNWLIGKRIAEEELKDTRKENYGLEIIKKLSKYLNDKYGKGYNKTNLYNFLEFYKLFPNIFHSVSGKSSRLLSWTHYRTLLQVNDKDARDWYEKEAYEQTWGVRTLQRNISTRYYYRLLKSQVKEPVIEEMKNKERYDKLEFIKNPLIAEFLGFPNQTSYTESDIESSIIDNIQNFLTELGKGYAFVARQFHIQTEKESYFIDLVFYNYILKCFVLVDLKTSKIRHQDIGQMDMYIRMFDEIKKRDDDNPTIGIILCSDTDSDIAKYSILNDSDNLFASKYQLYLPTDEELKAEIENQKTMFYLQNK